MELFSTVQNVLVELSVPVLTADDGEDEIQLVNPITVASYSWLERPKPTILVPGSPPIWNDHPLPFKVEKDNFSAFVDQNGHRTPEYPLYSLFASILHISPKYDFIALDLLSDRNNLRKLLRWIRGRGIHDATIKDFRIDVQRFQNTVIFVRMETKTIEVANKGYGLGFQQKVANAPPGPGAENQTGHNRMVRYMFEGIDMLVRFELDACLRADPSDADTLASELDSLTVSDDTNDNPDEIPVPHPAGLTIVPGSNASMVPASRTIELVTVTRKFAHNINWVENYPQVLLSQTHHHFLGLHDFGRFTEVKRRTLEDMQNGVIGEEVEGDLKRLGKILVKILEVVRERDERELLSLVCQNGALSLRKRDDGRQAVPPEYVSFFTCLPDSS
ncbi:hypothetical protein BKA62DRAFT_109705 [Auriculariales sp. MPI-PUGE-AT-0066]|nr:hypothetical protein BKA62DRAFT_109705 [Auriculariales sp. MPI-PUGE-AT-0066]